jgi:hypothetical protein
MKNTRNLDLYNRAIVESHGKAGMKLYREQMKKAIPFTLDDDIVDYIMQVSCSSTLSKRLLSYLRLGDPPFPVTWVEFNFSARIESAKRLQAVATGSHSDNDDGTPIKLGFLIEEKMDGGFYSVTTFGDLPRNDLFVAFPASFMFRTDGDKWDISKVGGIYGDKIKNTMEVLMEDDELQSLPWGASDPKQIKDIRGMFGIIPEPASLHAILQKENPDQFAYSAMVRSLKEQAGDLRFLIVALAVLGHVPVRYVPYTPKGSYRGDGRIKHYSTNSVVSIDIPGKRVRMKDIEKHLKMAFDTKVKYRWHMVRAHYRTSDRRINENWEWLYIERLHRYSWAIKIKSHSRGDPEVGMVTQVYEVKPPKKDD